MSRIHHDAAVRLAAKAMASGAEKSVRHSLMTMEWDISGRCEASVTREVHARPDLKGRTFRWTKGRKSALRVIMHLRCRRCRRCLAIRRSEWALRARAELQGAPRTWFGTLTLSVDNHFLMLSRTRERISRQGLDFDGLTPDDQFSERLATTSREVTLWLKRVRKQSEASIRYMLVAEAHKSGLPHFHCLVHEVSAETPVKYRHLTSEWTLGHSMFKLTEADTKAGTYVTKYLGKSKNARVRASLHYGNHIYSDSETEKSKRETTGPPELSVTGTGTQNSGNAVLIYEGKKQKNEVMSESDVRMRNEETTIEGSV